MGFEVNPACTLSFQLSVFCKLIFPIYPCTLSPHVDSFLNHFHISYEFILKQLVVRL